MQPAKKALKNALILSLCLTFALPLGGVMLGVGLAVHMPAVWAVGIALIGTGFYGCPCAWTLAYAPAHQNFRLVGAIVEEHLCTVQEIAAQLSLSEKEVRNRLDICFRKRLLTGYKRVGDEIVLNENRAPEKRTHAAECPYCGAKFSYTADDPRCPYCGSPVQQ